MKTVINLSIDRSLLEQLDQWRTEQPAEPTRAAAIAAAIALFLASVDGSDE